MLIKVVMIKKGENKYDLMIRLTQNRKRKFKSIKSGITIKQWDTKKNKLRGVRPADTDTYRQFLKNKEFIESIEKKYTKQINDLLLMHKPFSMNKVINLVERPNKINITVFEVFQQLIDKHYAEQKYGSRDTAKGVLSRLKGWHPQDLMFNELDDDLLLKYKNYLKEEGLSPASISIHLRAIRTLYNYAIETKVAYKNDYPFSNKNILKGLSGGYTSRALNRSDVDAIRTHTKELAVGSIRWQACNYFIFGYVSGGINFTDIARLKWENYNHGKITFVRYKTRSKTQEQTKFKVKPELKQILDWYFKEWKSKKQIHNPYIFPILNAFHNTEKRRHNRIIKVRKQINHELTEVGKELKLPVKVTTYVWRHTFATVMKNELNADISMISEILGHHDLKTTSAYLKQFNTEARDIATAGL